MPRGYGLGEATKDGIWELRAEGLSDREIGRRLGLPRGSVSNHLARTGGIRPRARRRRERCLSFEEPEEISRAIARGHSAREIARALGRSHTTITREINRCGGRRRYRAHAADREAWRRSRRPRPTKLELSPELRRLVSERLQDDHSPEQVAGWLRLSYPDNEAMHVSHETIYRALYVQARGALKRELTRHLRRGRSRRYASSQSSKGQGQGKLTGMVMISERPPEVDSRAVPGHWEGDLLMGGRTSAIATLVERQTRYCQLVALPEGTGAEQVADALKEQITTLPAPSALAHLGPGLGDVRAPALCGRVRGRGLLLRSPKPLAAGLQREHERPPSPVLPEGKESRRDGPGAPRRGRREAQRPPARDARLRDPGGEARRADRRPRGGRR
jgi:IS30 family transposase